jgi:hypothetical protein
MEPFYMKDWTHHEKYGTGTCALMLFAQNAIEADVFGKTVNKP